MRAVRKFEEEGKLAVEEGDVMTICDGRYGTRANLLTFCRGFSSLLFHQMSIPLLYHLCIE
jgi:hypothetical protein